MASPRYLAPTENRGILADPPFAEVGNLLACNRSLFQQATIRIDGTPLLQFRQEANAEIRQAAQEYQQEQNQPVASSDTPFLIAGHQPELFHPGVWIKNFALHQLAQEHGLTPFNLIVDNDTVKSTSLRFPVLASDPRAVHLQSIPFDEYRGEQPYEHCTLANPQLLASFVQRTESIWNDWPYRPMLADHWGRIWESVRYSNSPLLGDGLARGRREVERSWGCHNLELPIRRLCETTAFRRFAKHLLQDLPRFHGIYNSAVQSYRRIHRIRSRNHPVPDLAQEGNSLEAPFWTVDPTSQRRGRMMVSSLPDPLPSLRTRALTTTLFTRICLGEAFIHGLGGGIYDQVTDWIIQDWLKIPAPKYMVLTATIRLPLPLFATTSEDVKAAQRRIRDLYWNPQQELPNDPKTTWKQKRIVSEPHGKQERRQWFRDLQQVTESLRSQIADQLATAQQQLQQSQITWSANQLLTRRDFSWLLYPEPLLRDFFQSLHDKNRT